MEYILIAVLFAIQLLSFFWIALLHSKLNKFNDLEAKQQKLIEEMDNSIGAYLLEMKDENDRLIKELQGTSKQQNLQREKDITPLNNVQKNTKTIGETTVTEKPVARISKSNAVSAYDRHIQGVNPILPQQKVSSILKEVEPKLETLTFEQKVKKMYDDGQTIEQIAKNTNKGKTEIELLIKFTS